MSTEANTSTSIKITDLTSSSLISLLANRRSYYNLTSTIPIPDTQIREILTRILQTVPSAFNTQSTRLVLAVGTHHHQVWDITAKLLRTHMGESRWQGAPTAKKLAGFRAAHGTVLFYEDSRDVAEKKDALKNFAHLFDGWTDHTSGMHQLSVWTALEAEGMGANLQHYNGVIDDEVAKVFDVPDGWVLRAQLVFGGVGEEGEDGKGGRPALKEKKDTNVVLRCFGVEQ